MNKSGKVTQFRAPALVKTIKDTETMRTFLIECMINTAAGTMPAEQGRSVARLAQQVYNTAKLEVTYALAKRQLGMGDAGHIPAVPYSDESERSS